MAVAIEFANVIVLRSAIETHLRGGLDQFVRLSLANYLEDEHVVRVGFMSTHEALVFVDELTAGGLSWETDIALLQSPTDQRPAWLEVGERSAGWACWLRGAPGEFVDFDPVFLVRCREIQKPLPILLGRSGAVVVRSEMKDGNELLTCRRGVAEVLIDVLADAGQPAALLGRRDLTRWRTFRADRALMHDLLDVLVENGADDPRLPKPSL